MLLGDENKKTSDGGREEEVKEGMVGQELWLRIVRQLRFLFSVFLFGELACACVSLCARR